MPTVTKSLGEGTQSVLLTVAILESLASSREPIGISDLARQIGTSKSRIFRHLQTLVACDYVSKHASGEYEAGSGLLAFCRSINEHYDPVSIAEPILEDLRTKLGHTVIISRIVSTGIYVIKSVSGDSAFMLAMRPGSVLPFATSAQGHVALAFMPEAWRRDMGDFAAAYKDFSRVHRDKLDKIRRDGWAAAQMREGLLGLAAPVFDSSGKLIATLGLLDTTASMMQGALEDKGAMLVDGARTLSQGLSTAGIASI